MTLRTSFDRFFARDLERRARAAGDPELANAFRLYGSNRLIAVIGLAFTLVLIGFSVAQLVFSYGHPMPVWVLVIFLGVFLGAVGYSWWVGRRNKRFEAIDAHDEGEKLIRRGKRPPTDGQP